MTSIKQTDIKIILAAFRTQSSETVDLEKAGKELGKIIRSAIKSQRYNYSVSDNIKSLNAGLKHLERYKVEFQNSMVFQDSLPVLPLEHIPAIQKKLLSLEPFKRKGGPTGKAAIAYFDCQLITFFAAFTKLEPMISYDVIKDEGSPTLRFVESVYEHVREQENSAIGAWSNLKRPDLRRRLSKIKKEHYKVADVNALTHLLKRT